MGCQLFRGHDVTICINITICGCIEEWGLDKLKIRLKNHKTYSRIGIVVCKITITYSF
jgi:hypothetical protein